MYFGHSRERALASGADVGRYRGRLDWYVASISADDDEDEGLSVVTRLLTASGRTA